MCDVGVVFPARDVTDIVKENLKPPCVGRRSPLRYADQLSAIDLLPSAASFHLGLFRPQVYGFVPGAHCVNLRSALGLSGSVGNAAQRSA